VVATVVLVLLSPVLLVTALTIKLSDGGPVLFKQRRVGRGGEPFEVLKFRSMVTDAERIRDQHLEAQNESEGVLFKIREDPRITRFGRFIRRFSIDELPQLINVLRGEMSLIGPRPALEREVQQYQVHVRRRLDVRPGMTGLWQVSGRSDLDWDDTVRLDLYYVDNWSMIQDLVILLRTFKAVVSSNGAY
jgi:exopolysaccharide biosynthesis polyprenyl glycosylphosphotransferase